MDLPSLFIIPNDAVPDRADRILAELLPGDRSRSSIAKLIRLNQILRRGESLNPSTVLGPGDRIDLVQREGESEPTQRLTVPSFPILYEDDDLIVVDKPPGVVVHPGAGRSSGTLMDALVCTRPEMIGVGEPDRWGIVHRLDRDTSGVMVVAKNETAHGSLSKQFKDHTVHRIYLAIVRGNPGKDKGVVDAPIGRHAKDRKRISTNTNKARHAITGWAVRQRFGNIALLEVRPRTGRTHQIRVHLASVGLPVLGDQVYGKMRRRSGREDPVLKKASHLMHRQALHAAMLGFSHPVGLDYVEFSSELPEDMAEVIAVAQSSLSM
jgi:23S rRNA pseudouridine1911/1915/1917 synthase